MEWKSDFIESFVSQGLEQGRVEARREDVLRALNVRHLHPTDEQCAQVAACSDLHQLDRWFTRSITAETAAEVFED